MEVEEEESWEMKCEQLAELSSSEERSEKMWEEMESLRTLQLHQPTAEENHQERVNGDMRGASIVTSEADTLPIPTQPDGINICS